MSSYEWLIVRLAFSVVATGSIVIYGLTEGASLNIPAFIALAAASFFAGRCLGFSLAEFAEYHGRDDAE